MWERGARDGTCSGRTVRSVNCPTVKQSRPTVGLWSRVATRLERGDERSLCSW